MDMRNVLTVDNLSDFLDAVNDIAADWNAGEIWLRGVENEKYDLMPSLYRNKFAIDLRDETDLYSQFVRKAKAFIPDYYRLKAIDWYIIMQHYGFPTRLLDWTSGSLIALYFAVRNVQASNNRAVYLMDPFDFNNSFHKTDEVFCCDELSIKDYNRVIDYLPHNEVPDYPIAIEPPYFDKRIVAQKSCFTIHGKNRKPLNEILSNENFKIAKIAIDSSAILEIKDELGSVGITESILFPDLEGLSRELIFHYIQE